MDKYYGVKIRNVTICFTDISALPKELLSK